MLVGCWLLFVLGFFLVCSLLGFYLLLFICCVGFLCCCLFVFWLFGIFYQEFYCVVFCFVCVITNRKNSILAL